LKPYQFRDGTFLDRKECFSIWTPSDDIHRHIAHDGLLTNAILEIVRRKLRKGSLKKEGLTSAVQTLTPFEIFVKRILPEGDLVMVIIIYN